MALALLAQDEDDSDDKRWFRIDIGTNRYFRLAVGGPATVVQAGIRLVSEPTWISPLQGPVGEEAMGRTRFGIPNSAFSREARYVQMMSYRTSDRRGPAVSRILRAGEPVGRMPPAITFSRSSAAHAPVAKSLSYRPAMPQAMFLGGLLNNLAGLLPQIGQLVRGLIPAPAPVQPGGGSEAAQIVGRLTAPETIVLLQQLLRQVTATPAAPAAPALTQSRVVSLGRRDAYSRAQVLPIAALAPLLGQVMNPQTVQAVLEAPNRHTQTIINGLTDVIKLALEADAAQMEHLRKLNPGVDDPALDRLLESMSASLSGAEPGLRFQLFERVRLRFAGIVSVPILGETKVLYAHGRPLRFAAEVELPKVKSGAAAVLAPAVLELKVKDAATLTCKVVKRFPLGRVAETGPLPRVAELTAEECAGLTPGGDYMVTLSLAWKTKSGKLLGTLITQRITLAANAVFAGLEDHGEVIDLDDPGEHRDYWHRVWAGRFEADSKRIEGELVYTMTMAAAGESRNARLDAKAETRAKDRSAFSLQARIKAGMELALPALRRLGGTAPEAGGDGLDAVLASEAFRERMSLAVRVAFTIRGRTGESYALWTYPGFKRARLALLVPDKILESGNIAAFRESEAALMVPAVLHAVATAAREREQRSGDDHDNGGDSEIIDGQTVVGRYKAGFYPVRLVAERPKS